MKTQARWLWLFLGWLSCAGVLIDREYRQETVVMQGGQIAEVALSHKSMTSYSIGHMGCFGGNAGRYAAEIDVDGRHYKWRERGCAPLLLNTDGGSLWLACSQRKAPRYRLFKADDGEFSEVSIHALPKRIAFANVWVVEDQRFRPYRLGIPPNYLHLDMSATALLWGHLETDSMVSRKEALLLACKYLPIVMPQVPNVNDADRKNVARFMETCDERKRAAAQQRPREPDSGGKGEICR